MFHYSSATSLSFQKQKRTPKRTFSEGKIERRVNPTRNARPPEGFSVEKLAMDQVKNFRLRSDLSDRFVEVVEIFWKGFFFILVLCLEIQV